MNTPQAPVPVTIITGFLGSGKTTFVNELTAAERVKKIAIIENEFGEISIDQELLMGGQDNIFEVSGGCICCSVSDKLISYLLNLNQGSQSFQHLIIETTGIAEPIAVAEPFMSHPVIQKKYRLDSIICLVDSEWLETQLQEEEVVARQISSADAIILNKTDAVAPDHLQKLEKLMASINPFASIYQARHAKIAGATDMLRLQAHTAVQQEARLLKVSLHHQHLHDQITSYSFSFKEPLDYAKFYQWASTLMMFQNSRIYRIKGILNFEGEASKVVFQSVKNKFVLSPGSPWPGQEGEERDSRLVFIGRELNRERLQRQLRQCMARK